MKLIFFFLIKKKIMNWHHHQLGVYEGTPHEHPVLTANVPTCIFNLK